ncbi:biotin/lipoyl attachment, Acetyl-CoA biotin carboxyl carrier [Artemisia annua]|uniref:Biotin carboxyl carrier protein of acetyl-CoA carboxylase n=1 Tax=Artemisia annua TaxID=35608 RepID=A0A2U1Q2Z2_ARTAN|nr:biotin/lipoyl attachment, Acetyl-CoA biotin carboxyl carrier [Artemisia annua]
MASFTVNCPKTSSPAAAVFAAHSNPNQIAKKSSSVALFQSDLKSNRSLIAGVQSSKRNDVMRVSAQLNEVALEKSSNSAPAAKKDEDNTVPDAASITAFMTQVASLVQLVDSRDIMELELKQQNCEVLIRKKEALPQPPAAPMVMMQSQQPQAMYQQPHPMAGTFYRAPAPGAPAFVKVGDKVQKGQVVCIIEAMKLMNEIEADQSGVVVDIVAEDGKPVSLDTPLLVIQP